MNRWTWLFAVLLAAFSSGLVAQTPGPGPELSDLSDSHGSTMSFKLEKTILKVDVLHLTVRVDGPTGMALSKLVAERPRYGREADDSVATTVLEADEAIARIDFLRSIRLDQFLDGVDEDLGKAVDAGWVDSATFAEVTSGLRDWFGFLEIRGIKKGDRLTYHMRDGELRTTYRGVGETGLLLDQTDRGQRFVAAFWGGYYAPGTSFRTGLARSLWN
ncbi:MAG: hypothetical protein OEU54_01110 [Gemmatimonadota bacterium]|nr:hypothetical protein [Gemmatimonadota bacterium]